MSLVNFTLSEEGVGAFNDALVCIIKFSEDVSLEFKKDKVRSTKFPTSSIEGHGLLTPTFDSQLVLTAFNLNKSAYVSFSFAANRFFSRFSFVGNAQYREKFFCVIYIKVSRAHAVFEHTAAAGSQLSDVAPLGPVVRFSTSDGWGPHEGP